MRRGNISNTAYHKTTVPDLSGGVNLRDGVSLIRDNQLTDAKNVWYKNGLLGTRYGLKCAEENINFDDDFMSATENNTRKIYSKKENFTVIDGKTYYLTVIQTYNGLTFRYYADDFSVIDVCNIPSSELPLVDYSCNIFQFNQDIYCFVSGYYENEITPYFIFKIYKDGDIYAFKRITAGDIYVPTVAINLSYQKDGYGRTLEEALIGGTMLEGFNLLGNRARLMYSTVNLKGLTDFNPYPENPDPVEPWHYMTYYVPYIDAKNFTPELFEVNITQKDGSVVKHTVSKDLSGDGMIWEENGFNTDGLKIALNLYEDKSVGYIEFLADQDSHFAIEGVGAVTKEDYIPNNMEIIIPVTNTKENTEKVVNMTFSEWFGGSAEGIYGGIHLFLGGNTIEKEKSLVAWSDFNKPLYFSENNYAYVGDKTQKVTAFGKQDNMLVIFKQREMYYTKYVSRDSVFDAEDVQNQAIVDIVANDVSFPMTQIHGYIGCDCPNSVQLCRNRLVWAHSDGKVYTLTSASQWTERSVFEVSSMIERKIKTYSAEQLRGCLSADYEGCYVLSVGNELLLMDYNSYGYANVYAYNKSEDAQLLIPWWIWEMPKYEMMTFYDGGSIDTRRVEGELLNFEVLSLITMGTKLAVWGIFRAEIDQIGGFYCPELLIFGEGQDRLPVIEASKVGGQMGSHRTEKNYSIPTMLQTKFFDFSAPTIKKNIPKIEVSFGANGGVPINVTIITDNDTDENAVVLDNSDNNSFSIGYFCNKLFRLCNKRAYRVGVRFESEGNIFLDSISLQHKSLGGLK